MMKRIFAFIMATALCLGLVGCGGSNGSTNSGSAKDYAQIIHDARPAEFNESFITVSPNQEGEGFVGIDGFAADYTEPGQLDSYVNDMVLPLVGLRETVLNPDGSVEYKDFDPAIYTDFAVSISMMMTSCYGVAIVVPAEGQTEAVVAALENYVLSQQATFEFYLRDQYDIALNAIVTVAETGEVILVCCDGAEDVLNNILAALAA